MYNATYMIKSKHFLHVNGSIVEHGVSLYKEIYKTRHSSDFE